MSGEFSFFNSLALFFSPHQSSTNSSFFVTSGSGSYARTGIVGFKVACYYDLYFLAHSSSKSFPVFTLVLKFEKGSGFSFSIPSSSLLFLYSFSCCFSTTCFALFYASKLFVIFGFSSTKSIGSLI